MFYDFHGAMLQSAIQAYETVSAIVTHKTIYMRALLITIVASAFIDDQYSVFTPAPYEGMDFTYRALSNLRVGVFGEVYGGLFL